MSMEQKNAGHAWSEKKGIAENDSLLKNMQDIIKNATKEHGWTISECSRRVTFAYWYDRGDKTLEFLKEMTDDEKDEYYKGNNDKYVSADKIDNQKIIINIDGAEVTKYLKSAFSYTTFTKIIRGDKPVTIPFLVAFCKVFDISFARLFQDVFPDSNSSYAEDISFRLFLDSIFKGKQNYHYNLDDSKTREKFERLLEVGSVYAYFLPLSSDKKDKIINGERKVVPFGIMSFINREGVCQIDFESVVDSNGNENPQKYGGFVVISEIRRCAYCWLYEKNASSRQSASELFFLSFRIPQLRNEFLSGFKCVIAEVVSTSAYDDRPTMHRMLLCQKQLDENFVVKFVWPFLQLNTSKIYIKEDSLTEISSENIIFADEIDRLKKVSIPFIGYELDDSWSDTANNIKSLLDIKLLAELRRYSIDFDSNKIGKKVDGVLEYLFDRINNMDAGL